MFRLVLVLLFLFAIGAAAGLSAGWFFPGAWYWWAGVGGVLAVVGPFAWDVYKLRTRPELWAALVACALGVVLMQPGPAAAFDLVMRLQEPGSEVRLYDSPCVAPDLLEQLSDEYRDKFKAARAVVGGRAIPGCWIDDDGTAMMLFSNGEKMGVPMDKFADPMT